MQDRYYKSLHRLIMGGMVFLPLIPFLLVMGIGFYYLSSSLQKNTVTHIQRIVTDHSQMIDNFLQERKGELYLLGEAYQYERLSQPEILSQAFKQLQNISHAFIDLGIFNSEGIHIVYKGAYQLKGKNYAQSDWFKQVIQKGCYISNVYLGYRQIPHFIIAVKLNYKGKYWILRATVDSQVFNDIVNSIAIGNTGVAYIVNMQGELQTQRLSTTNNSKDENIDIYLKNKSKKYFISKDKSGVNYIYCISDLNNHKWLLVARQQTKDAFATMHLALIEMLIVAVLSGIVIISLALYLSRQVIYKLQTKDREKDKLNGQLIQASRLAELGEMATGFAHEINNPLQVIRSELSLMDMLLKDIKDNSNFKASDKIEDLEESVQQIDIQIDRGARITKAILQFGRQTETDKQNIDLGQLCGQLLTMVEKKTQVNGIEFKLDIEPDLPNVYADPGQLQQVVLNLFNNSMDAVLDKHGVQGGKIQLSIGLGRKKNMIEIKFSDNGLGISPKNMKKIFSPFFTTKAVGRGTGLGLSVCYGIIQTMGGSMEVDSEVGRGTIFTVFIPIAGGTSERC